MLTTLKSMPGDQRQLKSLGIDPLTAIHGDSPGLGSVDVGRFALARVVRPIHFLDLGTAWNAEVAPRVRSPSEFDRSPIGGRSFAASLVRPQACVRRGKADEILPASE